MVIVHRPFSNLRYAIHRPRKTEAEEAFAVAEVLGMRNGTRVIHAGLPKPPQGASFLPGPTFASVYHAAGEPADAPFSYGRFHNPTWTHYEAALGELEGGLALAFASGMAAVAAVFGAVLRPADIVVIPSDSYYTMRMLANGYFTEMGISVKMAATAANEQAKHLDGAKLLWLESPSNPGLDTCDIQALVTAAHKRGILVAVDNTTATMLGQRPLGLGADFAVASDTKALTGHGDILMGHVAVTDQTWARKLHAWRNQIGAIPGPMEVWLAHRSLATLDLRLTRQCDNALGVAQFLSRRSDVKSVRYPGLAQDPAHTVAARQMERFGPVVSFVLENRARAEAFLAACEVVYEATSFGGVHTTAERRARWGGDVIPEGFIRMNVGCEDLDDLLGDLAQALDKAAGL
jgi:cystathionine gamma-lyase